MRQPPRLTKILSQRRSSVFRRAIVMGLTCVGLNLLVVNIPGLSLLGESPLRADQPIVLPAATGSGQPVLILGGIQAATTATTAPPALPPASNNSLPFQPLPIQQVESSVVGRSLLVNTAPEDAPASPQQSNPEQSQGAAQQARSEQPAPRERKPDQQPRETQNRIREAQRGQGPERRGPEGRGPEGRGPEGRAPEGRGPEGRGPEGRGPEGRGPEGRGPEVRGPEGRGPEGRAPENHGAGHPMQPFGPPGLSGPPAIGHSPWGANLSSPWMHGFSVTSVPPHAGEEARLERLLESPVVSKFLALMQETTELKAQLKIQQIEFESRLRISELESKLKTLELLHQEKLQKAEHSHKEAMVARESLVQQLAEMEHRNRMLEVKLDHLARERDEHKVDPKQGKLEAEERAADREKAKNAEQERNSKQKESREQEKKRETRKDN